MFFKDNAKFKNGYLVTSLASAIKKYYGRVDYDVYNSLREVYDNNGTLTEDDVWQAISEFRDETAKHLFEVISREYKGTDVVANEIYAELMKDNYEDMQKKGISISCAYITAVRSVLGEDAKDVNIAETATDLIASFEDLEANCIRQSLEILQEDGMITTIEQYFN